MMRYRIVKIRRGDYRVMVIAPDGDLAVVGGFRRKKDALMWIVEQTTLPAADRDRIESC